MLLVLVAGCGKCSGPTTGDQCVSCHVGIEQIHGSIPADECVICHGGDPDARQKEDAHVPVPDNYWEVRGDALPPAAEGFIRDFSPVQLDAIGTEYVRFINPGDLRAVPETCGVCHPSQAETQPRSIMTTNAGHFMPTRYLAGLQDDLAIYSSYPVSDPDCDPTIEGSVCSLEALVPPSQSDIDAAVASGSSADLEQVAIDHYLAKSCTTCHAAGFGKNNAPHLYRSTGCSSCHMLYDKNGVYQGNDEAMPNNVPVYPKEHRLTTAIPTEQCATCHFQGGRIGLLYRGIREHGFGAPPENAEIWDESAYGHTAGYYLLDEDTTNTWDESPPDVHFAAGMHCSDCHVGSDVHGDGRIYSTSKQQVDIRCEDCHGTVREKARPDASGRYLTSTGRNLPQLSTDDDGKVVLTGRVDGAIHEVPQPADMLSSGVASAAMHLAMAPDSGDWSHTDSLTCDTCHTSYNLTCVGCHISYDMRLDQLDHQTGTSTTGLVRGQRDTYSMEQVLLGTAPDGRVQSVVMSSPLQLTVLGEDGELLVGADELDTNGQPTGNTLGVFRQTDTASANVGFNPFFQHTTTAKPRDCSTCHRTEDTPAEWDRVKGVYGFGTGEFMLAHPDGPPVDVMKFLDDQGNPITDWVHPGTGPVSEARRDRALAVEVP
ncbi:MAG: hypothetical protein KC912_13745 [Proteobacteria bacterium]|nr:hypothetical protein [Pseudomonadota bacterium]